MQVIIYTSPTCQSCKSIEEYLSSHGIDYTTIDVAQDQEALKRLVEITGRMLMPVIEINNEVIVGFDKPAIDRLLGL